MNLPLNPGLYCTSRLRHVVSPRTSTSALEWLMLGAAGISAALVSTLVDFNLRVPGHAILQVVFPIAVGLALVPRRGAGTVMGSWALLTALVMRVGGAHGAGMSLGALTSLTATGPMLDWTLRHSQGGWRQYLAFAAAGLASNLLAFLVRGGAKLAGWEHVGARPLSAWLPQAAVTYVVCGVLAGLVSGVVWFYGRRGEEDQRSAADRGSPTCDGRESARSDSHGFI